MRSRAVLGLSWALLLVSLAATTSCGDPASSRADGGGGTGGDGAIDGGAVDSGLDSGPDTGADAGPGAGSTYLKANNTGEDDQFGWSIALSADGSTLAVGAPGEGSDATGIGGDHANDSAPDAGAVYVFARAGATWALQAYLKASNTGESDLFGSSVALSSDGSTLAVGASHEESNATGIDGDQTDDSASGAGAVYVFARVGTTWSQQAYVKASNPDASDRFGHSVALSADGSTLAVGASHEESNATGIGGDQADNSASDAGAVYVLVRVGGTWSQQAYVKASTTDEHDRFGISVALSADGTTLAVGAPIEGPVGRGAVFVYERVGLTWSQRAYLKASNAGTFDQFGHAVTLSADGSTLAVGAYREDSNATGVGGEQANESVNDAGAAYIFERVGVTTWSQEAYLKASNTGPGDYFGISIALSADGTTLAVGARREGSYATGMGGNQTDDSAFYAGAAYVFARMGATWSQQAYVKASNTGPRDLFGGSVALSAYGSTLAVSAFNESSGATGIDGDQADDSTSSSGAVYVYDR